MPHQLPHMISREEMNKVASGVGGKARLRLVSPMSMINDNLVRVHTSRMIESCFDIEHWV